MRPLPAAVQQVHISHTDHSIKMTHKRTVILSASLMSHFRTMLLQALIFLVLLFALGSGQTPGLPIEYHIDEELPSRTMVGNVTKSSGLSQRYNTSTLALLHFNLVEQRSNNWDFFAIDDRGILRTTEVIDRDKICAQQDICAVNLRIIVQPIKYFQVIKVTVHIDDRNDNPPSFPQETIQRSVSEAAMPGTSFSLPSAEDLDSGDNGISEYKLNPQGGFFDLEVIDTADGSTDLHLVLTEKLDREQESSYTMWVTVSDGGEPSRTGSMLVQVKVTDANDNHPKFDKDTYEVMVPENSPVGTTILRVEASDPDEGDNGEIIYGLATVTEETLGHVFGMNKETGDIFVKGEIDYEEGGVYQLSVFATDKGINSLPAYAKVVILVEDLNDHEPVIVLNTLTPSGNAQVAEGSQPGLFVAHLSVEDPDGGEIHCTLDSKHFALQKLYNTEYKIITKTTFDRESKSEYHINLVCHDKGQPPLTSTKHIAVTVTDENDHSPAFPQPVYHLEIPENNDLGAFIIKLNATDEDLGRNSAVVYEILKADGVLRVDRISGVVTADTVFDHERLPEYDFVLVALDQGDPPHSATASLRISILDLNDEVPVFSHASYTFSVLENEPANTQIGKVLATDADSAIYNACLYAFGDMGQQTKDIFSIDAQDGILVTKQELDREKMDEYHLVVKAFNKDFPNVSTAVNVTITVLDVNDNAPLIAFTDTNQTFCNGTIEISNKVPKGDVIGYINATDVDSGTNAILSYDILSRSDELFAVDASSGHISVAVSLDGFDLHISTLTVGVKDQGNPQLISTEQLRIVVNRSVIFLPAYPKEPFWNAKTFFAVGVGVTFFLILICILIAVLIVRKRRNERDKKHTYNCRLEAEKTKSNILSGTPTSKTKKGRQNSSFESDLQEPEKVDLQGVEMGESCTDEGWSKHQESEYILEKMQVKGDTNHDELRDSGIEVKAEVSSPASAPDLVTVQRHSIPPQQHPPAYNRLTSPNTPLREMELQVQDMLHIIMREKESPSETGSYTDSGKGPSEEGDHSHTWQDYHLDTLKGLPTVAEAHVLAMTEGQHHHESNQGEEGNAELYSTVQSSDQPGRYVPVDEGIYMSGASDHGSYIPHNDLYSDGSVYGQPHRKAHPPSVGGTYGPSYTPPPTYTDSLVTAPKQRLVRFASYRSPADKGSSSQAVTRRLSDSGSRPARLDCADSYVDNSYRPDVRTYVSDEEDDIMEKPSCLKKWNNQTSLLDDVRRENPYESYESQSHCDENIYEPVNKPVCRGRKMVDSPTDCRNNNLGGPRNKHRTKLQRTQAERVANKTKTKPKVQFWDEGPVDKCVHDVVAKYVPGRSNGGVPKDEESLDGVSDDGATSTSGSYIIDSDDFLRDTAEQMYVDFIIV